MPTAKYQLWSTLSGSQRRAAITKVATRAGSDKNFRSACMGANSQTTIEDEAQVSFDPDMVVRCLPDMATAEKEIVLLLPDLPVSSSTPIKDYWLCTYVDYNP